MVNEDIASKMRKHLRWNPVIDTLFENTNTDLRCPFCDSRTIHVGWSIFVEEPRTASFDISCANCGERMHAAVFIPKNLPDVFHKP